MHYKRNKDKLKGLKPEPTLNKVLKYKTNRIHCVDRMQRDRQTSQVLKHYKPHSLRNQERVLKKHLDNRGRNGSTSGLTHCLLDDNDKNVY
jgi:hypothetical protein